MVAQYFTFKETVLPPVELVGGKGNSEVSLGGAPNIYEQPFESLNATFSQALWKHLKLNVSATNLLNDKVSKEQKLGNNKYISTQYYRGRTFSVGLSYEI